MPAQMSGAPAAGIGGGIRGWLAQLRRLVGVICFGYDAFISHSRADGRAYALALWAALEDGGLTACLDQRDFDAGDALSRKLKGTVSASRALILLDTAKARGSTFVADEISTAIEKGRRIVPIRGVGAGSQSWLHLPPEHRRALDELIWVDESAEGFASGAVRVETVTAIRRSLSTWTTRRRLARLAAGLAGLLLVAAASAAVASFATARVKALRWTLEDRGTSQRQAVTEVADFLAGPLFTVAAAVDRDDVDRLMNQAVQASIKAVRLDVPAGRSFVSPFGGAIVVVHGPAFEVRSATGSTTCATTLPVPPAAVGVDDAGTVLAVVTNDRVSAWRVLDCHPMVSGASWRAPGGDDGGPLGVWVLPSGRSGGELERDLLIWRRRDLVKLHLTATGVSASGSFTAGAADAFGDAQRLVEVRASPGSWIAVLAGPLAAFKADRLCVMPWSLVGVATCAMDAQVTHLALDPSGRYLVTGATDRTLRLYDLTKPLLEGPSATRTMSVRALASAGSGSALVALDTEGVLSLVDWPSLAPLARRAGFDTREAMLVGEFQRPAYGNGEAGAEGEAAPPAFSRAECVSRSGRVVAAATSAEGLVVHLGDPPRTLPLADVGVSRLAVVTVAAFAESCQQLVVAAAEGTTSELLVVDVIDRSWAEPSLRRRATRAVGGTISAIDVSGLQNGWIDVTLDIGEDVVFRVTERIAVGLSTVLAVLRGDPSAHQGRVALWAR
jgi:TIR domain